MSDVSTDTSHALFNPGAPTPVTSPDLSTLEQRFGRIFDAVSDFSVPTADSGTACDAALAAVFTTANLTGGVLRMSPRGHIIANPTSALFSLPPNWALYGETTSTDSYSSSGSTINFANIPYTIYVDPTNATYLRNL